MRGILLVIMGGSLISLFAPLRLRLKRLASVCLLAALFAWRVYRSRIPYGWV